MRFLTKLLREPLVHFLLIAVAVFTLYGLSDPEAPAPRERIVVSEGRIQQLVQVFTRTWQRPPGAQELRGLIDGYIKEEVYYREAVKLGLDRDDTLIRRRMQQKMEFLTEPSDAELQPDEAELQAFLDENRSRFRVEPVIAFRQVFISAGQQDAAASDRAADTLKDLRAAPAGADTRTYGDATMLPHEVPPSPLFVIARNFGAEFAHRLAELPEDQWSGPVESPFGLHLVRITEWRDGYEPALAEVREAVEAEWRQQKRRGFQEQEYRRLREKYEVVLPFESGGNGTKDPAAAQ